MNPFILSIDAGTTGITVLVLDHQANICKKYYREFTQYYPQPGWVEHDGEEIWKVTYELIQSAFREYNPRDCAGIGITNQRDPGKRLDINMYTEGQNLRGLRRLPSNLLDAIRVFEKSKVIRNGLGDALVDSYAKLKIQDWRSYSSAISQWERDNTLDC